MKKIVLKEDARNKLIEGVTLMYDVVCTTLGPRGRNVAISRQWGLPIIVHDGVTASKDVESKDEFVNMGVNLVREAAQKTNDEAGDGTTTSILLAYEIVKKGMALLEKGVNPMILRSQIQSALTKVIDELARISTSTKSQADLEKIAFISSADSDIGKLVGEAVSKVGEDGQVAVEEGFNLTEVEYTEGLEIDKGYATPYLVTNPQRMEAVIENAQIAVTDKKVTTQIEIVPLLEALIKKNKNVVIFGDIEGEALRVIPDNKVRGVFNGLVVPAPSFGDRRKDFLNDICLATGATLFSEELGLNMQDFAQQFNLEWIGSAKRVIATKKNTVILEGGGDKKVVAKYIDDLRKQKQNEKQVFEREKLEERLAKLTAGVAVIKVGAKTELEMRERVERVKDAVGAARAALEEGIVPGGGVAFIRIAKALKAETDGEVLLHDVLYEPVKKLLLNSGEENIEKIVKDIEVKGVNFGYEVNSGKIVDLITEGIIDPTKVIRLSLENACSVANSILTTDVLIVDENEKKDDK